MINPKLTALAALGCVRATARRLRQPTKDFRLPAEHSRGRLCHILPVVAWGYLAFKKRHRYIPPVQFPRKLVLLIVLTAAMFLLLLGRREFATSHEARVGQVARQMAAAGWPWNPDAIDVEPVHLAHPNGLLRLVPDPDAPPMHVNPWVVPILSGSVRLQKPPLPYWCAAIAFKLWGVSEAACRLVPALLGALATLLLYQLAGRLYGPNVATVSVLVWLTTYLVPEEYRLAMADPYLAFFTLLAVWAWVIASRRHVDRKIAPVPVFRSAGVMLVVFYCALGLGALSKGPLIFLHVAVPLVLYHVCFRARLPRGWVGHLVGIMLFCVIAIPWPLAVMRQVPNAVELWKYESVGELSGEKPENLRAWWYYLVNLPLMALPWVPLWLIGVAYPFVRNRSRLFFPVLWYGLVVVFFSVVGQKKMPYLLPMMPAQALLIAIAVVPLLRLARRKRMKGLPGAIVAAQVVIGIGWAAALPALVWHERSARAIAISVAVLAILISLFPFREMFAVRPARWLVAQSVAYAAVLLAFCNLYLTPLNNARSPVPVCRELMQLAEQRHAALLESKMPEEVAFYLPLHPPHPVMPANYLVVADEPANPERRQRLRPPEASGNPQHFEGWVPDAKVVDVRRIELPGASGNSRWKIYELTVRRTGFALR